jgi:hypothetical protein
VKTMILTCSRNAAFVSGYVQGLMQAMSSEHFAGWAHLDHESDIARGRSKLLDKVLTRTDCDSFLWVDDDIAFTGEDFDTMATAPVDVVGGLYVLRHESLRPCYGKLMDATTDDAATVPIVAVDVIGTGFLRMTRRAIEAIRPLVPKVRKTSSEGDGWTHWFHAGVHDDTYMSEDWAFCHHVWKSGGEVYLHRGVKLGHVGKQVYRPE